MESRVVLDLHGTRARAGIDIDAFEVFLRHFRAVLREYDRSLRGSLARRGGHPDTRDVAASAFRLVEFHVGSAIATLEPVRPESSAEPNLPLADSGEDLSVSTVLGLVTSIESDRRLPDTVVEALDDARRAIGEDGSFGVEVPDRASQRHRIVIDDEQMKRLRKVTDDSPERTVVVTGRLHMIEVDQPGRRVGIRAQDGVDWTCLYPDELHEVITTQLERLVRVEGIGRKLSPLAGRLRIVRLAPLAEHVQEPLFTVEPISVETLRDRQGIGAPQGLSALIDEDWTDDEESQRFLEATLGSSSQQ